MKNFEITHLTLKYTQLRIMDAGRVDRLVASMARDGQRSPVLVTGSGVLVDGYHRVQALRELGRDLVLAVTLDVDVADALILAWNLERGRRRNALEESWMLAELMENHDKSVTDLTLLMRRTKSWVSERLGLLSALPQSVQNAVRTGKIPANGAMKSLVPFARTDREACKALVAALDGPVTVRQLACLYGAWRRSDTEGRQRIVAHPMLLLKSEEAAASVPLDLEEQLTRDFEAVAGLCRRARRRTKEGAFPRGNSTARRAWHQALEGFHSLEEEVRLAQA